MSELLLHLRFLAMTGGAPRHVAIGNITIGNDRPLVFIAGPNTLESRAHALEMSAALAEIANKLGIALIYKTSFDKANRSSIAGERGIGLTAGLPILAEIRERTGLAMLTDIHEPQQCAPVAERTGLRHRVGGIKHDRIAGLRHDR